MLFHHGVNLWCSCSEDRIGVFKSYRKAKDAWDDHVKGSPS